MPGLFTAGSIDAACQHLEALCREGSVLSTESLLRVFQTCTKTRQLSVTRRVHALIVKSQRDKVPIVADHLIRMFAESGSLQEANLVFRRVDEPNVHTWNAIIAAHIALGESNHVFDLYDLMIREGTKPDKFMYMNLFKVCGNAKDVVKGKSVHEQLVGSEFAMDVTMGSVLIDMYGRCGAIELARNVFDNMLSCDKVTYNSMIGAYVLNGNCVVALELLGKMQAVGIGTDRVTFLNALKACSLMKSLDHGKAIHRYISDSGLGNDVVIGSTLIDMYTKCGSMDEAHRVFDELPNRNVVSWGAIIAAYAQRGHGLAALSMFEKMQEEGIKPDRVILACLLKACGSIPSILHGHLLHEQVIKENLESDVFVSNNLFYMYAKAGSLEEARKIFDSLSNKDVISWATMIAGYALNGQGLPALDLFKEMQRQGITPDEVTYSCVLKACGSVGAAGEGKLIHDKCSKEAETDVILANTLIDMYAKCGNLKAARRLFDALPNRDVVSWNCLLTAYIQDGQGKYGLELFKEMQREGIRPTNATFLGALKACVNAVDLEFAKGIHDQLIDSGMVVDGTIINALIDAYCKCGGLSLAHELFASFKSPDVVTWGAMIGGYVHNGHYDAAIQLFKKMQQEGVKPDNITLASVVKACGITGALEQGQHLHNFAKESGAVLDVVVGNALMDLYSKCGCVEKAIDMFEDMPTRDVISWNTMISAYTLHGQATKAVELFEKMPQSIIKPDEATFSCILKACSNVAFIEQGRRVHDYVVKNKVDLSSVLGNTLLDMYVKCGNLREARCVFNSFPARDVVSWGVMIAGYAQHGLLDLAKQFLGDMLRHGHKPDSPIHLTILAAYRQAGLANEGYSYFKSMDNIYGTPPGVEHFNILVDLLGRAGRLEEAKEVLRTVPSIPAIPAWVSLLTGCKAYGNKGVGHCCFEELSCLDPKNMSRYAMLWETCLAHVKGNSKCT